MLKYNCSKKKNPGIGGIQQESITKKMDFLTFRGIPRRIIKITYICSFPVCHLVILILLIQVRFISLIQIERELFVIIPHACAVFYYGLVEFSVKMKQVFLTCLGTCLFYIF